MIYLDYNATSPVDDAVVEAMLPYLTTHHGNPSSSHALGAITKAAVVRAREQVASLLHATPDEIVFTSGGSESNNHVLKGVADCLKSKGDHLIVSAVEHPAIHAPCAYLERRGYHVTRVPVDGTGRVDPDDVRNAITPKTILVSVMHANNEVGTIQPIAEIASVAHEAGVWMHSDAAQSVGKIDVHVHQLGVDFLSLAGHKLYAPPGIGALFIRKGIEIEPLVHGAGHEQGRRAGTEGVPNIVALGAAAELASNDMHADRIRALTAKFHTLLTDRLGDGVVLNGHPEDRLPNTLNVGFRGFIGLEILGRLTDICASPGAACHFDRHEPSPVLSAMGVPQEIALGAIRFSLGRPTTDQEIEQAAQQVTDTVAAMVA